MHTLKNHDDPEAQQKAVIKLRDFFLQKRNNLNLIRQFYTSLTFPLLEAIKESNDNAVIIIPCCEIILHFIQLPEVRRVVLQSNALSIFLKQFIKYQEPLGKDLKVALVLTSCIAELVSSPKTETKVGQDDCITVKALCEYICKYVIDQVAKFDKNDCSNAAFVDLHANVILILENLLHYNNKSSLLNPAKELLEFDSTLMLYFFYWLNQATNNDVIMNILVKNRSNKNAVRDALQCLRKLVPEVNVNQLSVMLEKLMLFLCDCETNYYSLVLDIIYEVVKRSFAAFELVRLLTRCSIPAQQAGNIQLLLYRKRITLENLLYGILALDLIDTNVNEKIIACLAYMYSFPEFRISMRMKQRKDILYILLRAALSGSCKAQEYACIALKHLLSSKESVALHEIECINQADINFDAPLYTEQALISNNSFFNDLDIRLQEILTDSENECCGYR